MKALYIEKYKYSLLAKVRDEFQKEVIFITTQQFVKRVNQIKQYVRKIWIKNQESN